MLTPDLDAVRERYAAATKGPPLNYAAGSAMDTLVASVSDIPVLLEVIDGLLRGGRCPECNATAWGAFHDAEREAVALKARMGYFESQVRQIDIIVRELREDDPEEWLK